MITGQVWFGVDLGDDESTAKSMIKYLSDNNIKDEDGEHDPEDPEDLINLIPEDVKRGIEINNRYSDKYPSWMVFIADSYCFAIDEGLTEISIVYETSEEERLKWKAQIINFCVKIGIEINPDEIDWHLSSTQGYRI